MAITRQQLNAGKAVLLDLILVAILVSSLVGVNGLECMQCNTHRILRVLLPMLGSDVT